MSSGPAPDTWSSILRDLSTVAVDVTGRLIAHGDNGVRTLSLSNIVARRRRLEQRERVLERARFLHHAETKNLHLLERRVQNSLTPIGRIPTEILIMIFRLLKATCTLPSSYPSPDIMTTSGRLAAVCHRWFSVMLGPSGRSFWTDITLSDGRDRSFFSALQSLRLAFARSGDLPLRIELVAWTTGATELPSDALAIAHMITGESERIQSLSIESVSTFVSLFPLSNRFTKLERLRLSCDYEMAEHLGPLYARPFFFLRDDTFPCLHTIELDAFDDTDVDDIVGRLGGLSPVTNVRTLTLSSSWCDLTSVLAILRCFPNVRSLDLSCGFGMTVDEVMELAEDPDVTVMLPKLETVQFLEPQIANILTIMPTPSLRSLTISRGYRDVPVHMDFQHSSHLRTLSLGEGVNRNVFVPQMIPARESVECIRCSNDVRGLGIVLAQVFAHAHQSAEIRRRLESSIQPRGVNPSPVILLLHLVQLSRSASRDRSVPSTEDVRRLHRELEALSAARKLREQVYGPAFRIQLSDSLIQHSPSLVEVVSRFSDFLEIVTVDAIVS